MDYGEKGSNFVGGYFFTLFFVTISFPTDFSYVVFTLNYLLYLVVRVRLNFSVSSLVSSCDLPLGSAERSTCLALE